MQTFAPMFNTWPSLKSHKLYIKTTMTFQCANTNRTLSRCIYYISSALHHATCQITSPSRRVHHTSVALIFIHCQNTWKPVTCKISFYRHPFHLCNWTFVLVNVHIMLLTSVLMVLRFIECLCYYVTYYQSFIVQRYIRVIISCVIQDTRNLKSYTSYKDIC